MSYYQHFTERGLKTKTFFIIQGKSVLLLQPLFKIFFSKTNHRKKKIKNKN